MSWSAVVEELTYVLGIRRKAIAPEDEGSDSSEGSLEEAPCSPPALEVLSASIAQVPPSEEIWERAAMAKEALERERQLLHVRKLLVNQQIREGAPKPTGWLSWLW